LLFIIFIDWRPTKVFVDSKTHDREWAMVSAVGQRSHTSGGKFFLVPKFQDQNLIHNVVHSNTMKAYRGRRGIAHLILNLTTKGGDWLT
jgi:hypothetical protein